MMLFLKRKTNEINQWQEIERSQEGAGVRYPSSLHKKKAIVTTHVEILVVWDFGDNFFQVSVKTTEGRLH